MIHWRNMGLKDLHLKFKVFPLRRLLIGDGGKKRDGNMGKRASWMTPVSHGYHVVDRQLLREGSEDGGGSDPDSVVVQREQVEQIELWVFGVFDAGIGDAITKYLQSHLFDRNPKESYIRKESKETMKRAYLRARAKIREARKTDEPLRLGSASVMVVNGEKLVVANMGNYRTVVCRDGLAYQWNSKHQQTDKRHWSRRLFSVRILSWKSSRAAGPKHPKGSELVIGTERVDTDTEFIIIASTGIWEVMRNQEAVDLIRHIGDPQEAANWLAKEALTRMSKGSISCIVVRFD